MRRKNETKIRARKSLTNELKETRYYQRWKKKSNFFSCQRSLVFARPSKESGADRFVSLLLHWLIALLMVAVLFKRQATNHHHHLNPLVSVAANFYSSLATYSKLAAIEVWLKTYLIRADRKRALQQLFFWKRTAAFLYWWIANVGSFIQFAPGRWSNLAIPCLLYTSDAADE